MGVLVSVIVPNYNHSDYLEERIISIINQSYSDFELILLDDGSVDRSVDILKKYALHPKVVVFEVNTKNSGSVFLQWMKGLEFAVGKYVWIAESDDFADPDFLKLMIEAIEKSGSVMAVCGSRIINEKGVSKIDRRLTEVSVTLQSEKVIQDYLFFDCTFINVSAIIFERNALKKSLANMPSSLKLTGDWFCYLLVALSGTVTILSDVLNNFRTHSGTVRSSTARSGLWLTEGAFIQEYVCAKKIVNTHQRKQLKRILYLRFCKSLSFFDKRKTYTILFRISGLIGIRNTIKGIIRTSLNNLINKSI